MQLAPTVSIPDELELARVEGHLVVFAGAGVSMGPPALLPSFRDLAEDVGGAVEPLLEADERALDRYLGRLERNNVRVQERARDRLRRRRSGHNVIHESLLGIFGEASRVRLITTNFDTHFTTAAESVFGDTRLPFYVGPALPPGPTFRGIAQLHGSLDQEQDRLVLTDTDFATAYMADGWASRFLVGVFAERTILFVGYSITDPLMQYLIRALPAGKRSFALCHQEEVASWKELAVTSVTFGTGQHGERFGELNDALKRWRWYAQASPTDHAQELKALIRTGPPASPVDADYLRARVRTEAGRTVFSGAATETEWFSWAANEGLLDPLTDEASSDAEAASWALWTLDRFASGDAPPLLKFMRRRGPHVHRALAMHIAIHLARGPLPPEAVLGRFVALLTNQRPRKDSGVHQYEWLLRRLVDEKCDREALALLRWMTFLRLETVERYYALFESEEESEAVRPLTNRVDMVASPSDLGHFMKEKGPALAALASDELIELGMQRIGEAYELLSLAGAVGEGSVDWFSLGRTAIAPSNQDTFSHPEDVVLDLVRCGLDHWSEAEPSRLEAFGNEFSQDDRSLVRRLALYAVSRCTTLAADAVLERAREERWAMDFQARPEFYRVLKTHYAGASEGAKESFIGTLRNEDVWGDLDSGHAHVRFSISCLLARLDPTGDATTAFADAERSAHPEWAEQDPDGYLTRIEVGVRGEAPSPLSAEKLLAADVGEALSDLADALGGENDSETGQALLGAAQQAVTTDPRWGVNLLEVASTRPEVPSALTNAVLWALRDVVPDAETQLTFLSLIERWQWPEEVSRPLGSVLDWWARRLASGYSEAHLDAIERAADVLYKRSKSVGPAIASETGWTEQAMNHPAGHAAEVWWMVANARNRVDGQFVLAIGDGERERWERVLVDTSAAGSYGRVILAMASDRLSNGDHPWAQKHLFPAFDPENGLDRASQLWDGRLSQHHFSWTTIAGLAHSFEQFFSRSSSLVPARARELGDFVGLLVTHPAESGFSLRLLQSFVRGAAPDARLAFADSLPKHLGGLERDGRLRVWNDILGPYWRDRRTNVPLALSPEEIGAMSQWITVLPEVADRVIGELRQTDGDNLPHAEGLIWEWSQDPEWVRAHPREASETIKWLAERRSIPTWMCDKALGILETSWKEGAAVETVLAATEVLAAIPWDPAFEFANRLRRGT